MLQYNFQIVKNKDRVYKADKHYPVEVIWSCFTHSIPVLVSQEVPCCRILGIGWELES